MPGLDLNGSTILPDVLVTKSRPVIVILNRQEENIFILEITWSFESNIECANTRKQTKYTSLKTYIDRGYS